MRPVSTFKPIKRVRAYEAVVSQVEAAIFAGELSAGERLPSERDLLVEFGVSRATVREALRVLESSGLIRLRPGDPAGGAEVRAFSTDVLRKSLTSLVHLANVDLAGTVEFRMVIEGAATHLAAEARSDSQLESMKTRNEEVGRHAVRGDHHAFKDADAAFHQAVAQSSGNPLLSSCGEVIHAIVINLVGEKLLRARNSRALMEEIVERHAKILSAIEASDPKRAAAIAKQDIYDYYGPWLDDHGRARLASLMVSSERRANGGPQVDGSASALSP